MPYNNYHLINFYLKIQFLQTVSPFSNGKKHDFRLFKESKILIHPKVKAITDSGYQGIQKIHNNSELPKKKARKIL